MEKIKSAGFYLKLLKALVELCSFALYFLAFLAAMVNGFGLQPKSWLWLLVISPAIFTLATIFQMIASHKEGENENTVQISNKKQA